jgi:hypothetical protein
MNKFLWDVDLYGPPNLNAIQVCTLVEFVPDKPEYAAFQRFNAGQASLVTLTKKIH